MRVGGWGRIQKENRERMHVKRGEGVGRSGEKHGELGGRAGKGKGKGRKERHLRL